MNPVFSTHSEAQAQRLARFIALADDLAQRFAARAADHDRERTFPFENYADLHSSGYLALTVPADYGGEEASLYELVQFHEHLARGDGATALAAGMTLHILGRLRETRQWPEALYERVCRAVVSEGALLNAAATEPDMGSPSHGGLPATTATPNPDGTGWLVTGHKQFVSLAPVLRYLLVSVRLPATPEMPHGGSANALIERPPAASGDQQAAHERAGLRMVDTWSANLSMRTSGSYDIYFDQVAVPDDMLLDRKAVPPPDQPARPAKAIHNTAWFGLLLAAVYLGIGQAACDAACRYAHERTPAALGRPIATLPNIQRRIGDMHIQLTAARSVLHQVALQWSLLSGSGASGDQLQALAPQLASAKYLCTNAAVHASDQAMRVAGGFSLLHTLPFERYYRDARAGLAHPPNDDMTLELVGRMALER